MFVFCTQSVVFCLLQPNAPFIQRYIFPDGEIPHEANMAKNIEKSGLIMSDRQTLIRHYNKTLEAWRKRFLKKSIS